MEKDIKNDEIFRYAFGKAEDIELLYGSGYDRPAFNQEAYKIKEISTSFLRQYDTGKDLLTLQLGDCTQFIQAFPKKDVLPDYIVLLRKQVEQKGRTCHANADGLLPEIKNLPKILSSDDKDLKQTIKKYESDSEKYVVLDKVILDNLNKSFSISDLISSLGAVKISDGIDPTILTFMAWMYINQDTKHETQPTGYLEFTQTSEPSKGRIVVDVLNNHIYWTATHYKPWKMESEKITEYESDRGLDETKGWNSPWLRINTLK